MGVAMKNKEPIGNNQRKFFYVRPESEVVEIKSCSVLCGSPDYFGFDEEWLLDWMTGL